MFVKSKSLVPVEHVLKVQKGYKQRLADAHERIKELEDALTAANKEAATVEKPEK